MLRLYVTGNLAIEDGDRLASERDLPGRQARTLLAVLTLERDHATTDDRLAEILWNGNPPNAWQTALRALVSKLRSVIRGVEQEAAIEHASGRYQLRLPSDAWVDVEAAGAAIHQAEAALRAGDLAAATGEALVANAIARRPFLLGDEGPWVERQRAHLRDVRVRALTVRGQAALDNDDPTGAATDAELVIDLDPYRESAYVSLMTAQVAVGDAAKALATYERLRAKLASDLGAAPSPESEKAFLEILRRT